MNWTTKKFSMNYLQLIVVEKIKVCVEKNKVKITYRRLDVEIVRRPPYKFSKSQYRRINVQIFDIAG